jgi:signal transduction histidine kinase
VAAIAVLPVALVVFGFLPPIRLANPGVKAAVETTVALVSVVVVGLVATRFMQSRRVRDLLLFAAVLAGSLGQIEFSVLPTLLGGSAETRTGSRLAALVVVALVFMAAALASRHGRVAGSRRPLAIAAVSTVALLVVAESIGITADPDWAIAHVVGFARAQAQPSVASVIAVLAAIAALLIAGGVFMARAERGAREAASFAAAAFLFASAQLQYLKVSRIPANWMTPGTIVRAGAWGCAAWGAMRLYARAREAVAAKAMVAERERIAQDLHDGLAQDLAFIVAHGDQLATELGAEHPLAIAAARALAAARGAIVDLTASAAPNTGAALKTVAAELARRFNVDVAVDAEAVQPTDTHPDLDHLEREQVVRIAREAIVNAVKHGGAQHVRVKLGRRDNRVLLSVSDDGCGLDAGAPSSNPGLGIGLPAMQARAETLGGRLVARPRKGGGTEITVLAS